MNRILKECKNKIRKIVGICSILLYIAVIFILIIWGKDIKALIQGPVIMEDISLSLVESENNTEEKMKDLDHQYTSMDVEMIIGSYAEYGKSMDQEVEVDKTYYLMPVNQGTYFITLIADKENMAKLDEMEDHFIHSIGSDGKEYAEPISVKGGFQALSTDAKMYAMEYFEGYDENVETMEDLSKILSPYAFEIDYIGGYAIENLWILYYIGVVLIVLLLILLLLYSSNVFLYKVKKMIKELPHFDSLEEDFNNAVEMDGFKYGEKFLYKEVPLSYHIWAYENFIWLYKKEIKKQKEISYEVWAYDKKGSLSILEKKMKKKSAEKCLNRVFDHRTEAIIGYQSSLDERVKQDPKKLYDKVKELKEVSTFKIKKKINTPPLEEEKKTKEIIEKEETETKKKKETL